MLTSAPSTSSNPTPAQINGLWKQGNLSYKLHDGQKLIRRTIRSLPASTRESLVLCSRRYGKSFLACVMALEDGLRTPNATILIMGPTIKQSLEIVRPLFAKILQDMPSGLITQSKSEKRWNFKNGSQLIIAGFDTASESVRGLDINKIYLEESGLADLESYDYILQSILYPTLMHSQGGIIHLTTPSKIIDHPLHTVTLPKTSLNGSFFKFTIRDNPLLTPEIIESEIENLGGYDSPHTQRELFCNIIKDEQTMVVPQFEEARHVQELSLPDDAYFWVAGDIGGVRDKSVLLLMAYDYSISKICVIKEVVADPHTPTSVIVKQAQAMEGGLNLPRFIDAPGQLFIDLSATYNYPCFPPEKLEFDHNIARLQTAFYHDQILIAPICKTLITTLRSGQLNKQKTDFSRTSALGHCDAIAALIYGIRHADRRKAEQPKKPGTFLATRDLKTTNFNTNETLSGLSGANYYGRRE